jgi:Concanavalin A-like lectin/glucanases superfamily
LFVRLLLRLERFHVLYAALTVLAAAVGCGQRQEPGVLVELHAPTDPDRRPDWLWIYWMAPRNVAFEGRLPEHGLLPASGSRLASMFVRLNGPFDQHRLLVVRGQRGGQVVCGGTLRIDPGPEPRPAALLQLGPPLPDQDGDGLPDLLEDAGAPAADGDLGGVADAGVVDGPAGTDGGGGRDSPPARDAVSAAPDQAADRTAATPDAADDSPAADPLRIGLVAHWRFDDGAGSAVARDSSGHNNVGRLLGASITSGWIAAGRVAGALTIPEADGYGALVLPTDSVAKIGRAFTIAAWTRRSSNRSGNSLSTVLSRRAPNSITEDYFALAFTDSGRLRGSVNTQLVPRPPTVTSPEVVPLDRWVHVAFTYDGAILRLFVDGVAAGTANYVGLVGNAGTTLCLGCAHNRPGHVDVDESLGGGLDELLLYARALPSDEIARLARGDLPILKG